MDDTDRRVELRKYILDTNAILQRPELLGRSLPAGSLVVPAAVMRELGGRIRRAGSPGKLLELLADAVRSGVLTLENVDFVDPTTTLDIDPRAFTDATLIAHARRLKSAGDEPVIVTSDRQVILEGMKAGFEVLTPTDVLNQLDRRMPPPAAPAAPLQEKANEAALEGRRTPRLLVLIGIVIGLLAVMILEHLAYLLETIPVWGTFGTLIGLAVGLYWIRGRWRLLYGVAEFVVGLASSWIGARTQIVTTPVSPVVLVQILGGIYVMVRGLDNMGKGVLATRYSESWERIFGKQ